MTYLSDVIKDEKTTKLRGAVQYTYDQLPGANREQIISQKLAPDIDNAAEILGESRDKIEQDVLGSSIDFFGLKAVVDEDDARLMLKQRVGEKMVADFDTFVAEGGEATDDDLAVIAEIKDKLNIGKTPVDIIQESVGSGWESIGNFFNTSKEVLSDDIKRNGLLETVGDAIQTGVKDPANFLDALATLGIESVIDEVGTGIGKTASDLENTLGGGKIQNTQRLALDIIPNGSAFSGSSLERLKDEQPAAAFIASIIPFILRGRSTGKILETKGVRGVQKVLRTAVDEAVFEGATGSAGTVEGKTLQERMGQRTVNATAAFLASLGIEGGIEGVRGIARKYRKAGIPEKDINRVVTEEVQNNLEEVLQGEKEIDADAVYKAIEEAQAKLDARINADRNPVKIQQGKDGKRILLSGTKQDIKNAETKSLPAGTPKDDEISKMNATQLEKALADQAGMERRLRNKGFNENEIQKRIKEAKRLVKQRKTKIMTPDENRKTIKEAKRQLTETSIENSMEKIKSASKKPISDAQAKAEANEQAVRKSMAAKIKQVQARRKAAPVKEIIEKESEAAKSLEEVGINKFDGDDKVASIDSTTVPFDGNFMDQFTAKMGALGLAGLNRLVGQTPRLDAVTNTFIDAFGMNKKIIGRANQDAGIIYKTFADKMGTSIENATRDYLDSGMYRSWSEGLMKDAEFSSKELDAFKELKKAEVEYNKLNLSLIEDLGTDTKNFNPEAYTDASRGQKLVTIDVTNDPKLQAQIEQSGYKVIEISPTKQNPQVSNKKFFVLDYGDSMKEILQKVDEGRFYYQKKAPWLFENNKLRTDIFTEQQNISRQLYELGQETTLTPEQLGAIKGQLLEQGYPDGEISDILGDIAAGNTDFSAVRRKIKKMFVGSLKASQHSKIGIKADVVNARRLQNIQLSKKLYRDQMTGQIDTAKSEINKFITANADKLTDKQMYLLREERFTLDRLQEMVDNKPGPVEKIILFGLERIAGEKGFKVFRGMRDFADQFLGVEAAMKLSFNLSGSAMNVIEAIRATGDAAIQIPDKAFAKMYQQIKNPIKYIQDTQSKMAASKRYAEFYLEDQFDATIDTRFKNKKNWASTITNSGMVKVGMSPFNTSIKLGKIYAYNIGEALGQTKGLKGQELDDFIFKFMSERGQIQDLNVSALSKNDTVLKSAFFLKNFMFRTAEFEIDAWRRLLGSAANKSVDMDTARKVFAFSAVPAALFGIGTSPTAMIANGIVTGITGGQFNPYLELQKSNNGSVGAFLGRGLVGNLLNISTKQMTIDPVQGLGQKNVLQQSIENFIVNPVQKTWFNASLAADTGDFNLFLKNQLQLLDETLAKEVTAYGRYKKAEGVVADGVLRSVGGIPIENGIPEKDRPVRAAVTAAGFNSATADQEYAKLEKAFTVKEFNTALKKQYTESAAAAYKAGDQKRGDAILDVAEKKGFDISDKAIDNAIDKKEMTRSERLKEQLTDEQTEQIEKAVPELYDDNEDSETVNDIMDSNKDRGSY